jgi:hypothetical protein
MVVTFPAKNISQGFVHFGRDSMRRYPRQKQDTREAHARTDCLISHVI